jgi:CRP-like cAMP-binding protein
MSGKQREASSQGMSSEDLARALPKLTPEQVAQVSPKLARETYSSGKEIIRQGETPDRFFIVIRGHAEVCHENLGGHIEVVDTRKPGEYFGEIGLLRNRPRTATVRAPKDAEVEVLALQRKDFEEMIDESRATETHVAREMILRLIHLADFQS